MKIAISSAGTTLNDQIDRRFGRAAMFIIYDLDLETFTVVDNAQNLNAAQGAGIQAAQHIVNAGVGALVTGHTGPKAFKVLEAAAIPVYLAEGGTVREAIDAFRSGTLAKISEADVEGHWV
jgi:predicted Fe-Mo cluster-binding NifX family protein